MTMEPSSATVPGAKERMPWLALGAATVVAAAAFALIWFVAVPAGPLICPAVYPPAPNCIAENRAGTGVVMSGIVAGTYAVALATLLLARARRGIHVLVLALLVVVALVSHPVVVWSSGFMLS